MHRGTRDTIRTAASGTAEGRDRDTPTGLRPMSVAARTIGGMRTLEICERCDGTGADPFQHSEEITVCVECSGDGCHVTYYAELAQTA